MDRPEWITSDAKTGWVYCTLTNNSNRGKPGFPGVDAANPRADNTMGNIIRWKDDGDFSGSTFAWNHFIMAGDSELPRADAKGNVKGDKFGSATAKKAAPSMPSICRASQANQRAICLISS